jgi:dimethylargininase
LHLKSAVTYLGNGHVILAPAYVDPSFFKEYHLLELSEAEAYCANCLNVNGTILMPEGYEQVKKRIDNLGFPVIELDMSEFKKGDGALTCKALLY